MKFVWPIVPCDVAGFDFPFGSSASSVNTCPDNLFNTFMLCACTSSFLKKAWIAPSQLSLSKFDVYRVFSNSISSLVCSPTLMRFRVSFHLDTPTLKLLFRLTTSQEFQRFKSDLYRHLFSNLQGVRYGSGTFYTLIMERLGTFWYFQKYHSSW